MINKSNSRSAYHHPLHAACCKIHINLFSFKYISYISHYINKGLLDIVSILQVEQLPPSRVFQLLRASFLKLFLSFIHAAKEPFSYHGWRGKRVCPYLTKTGINKAGYFLANDRGTSKAFSLLFRLLNFE